LSAGFLVEYVRHQVDQPHGQVAAKSDGEDAVGVAGGARDWTRPGVALVGRVRELSILRSQVEVAADGRASVVLVAGEPGIGKTRLMEEAATRAANEGVVILRGGASQAEAMPPYLPFLEALGQHVRATAPERLREQAGETASILARILPELATRLGALPADYPLPPDQARLRLYEAVGAFLAAIASSSALILLLDDLHWADSATLDLLCYMLRSQPDARLLVLGAYRDGESADNPAFERAVAELNRLRLLRTVTLGPFPPEDIATLAVQHLGIPLDPATGELLRACSEGNPFFAEELLRDWVETDALARTEWHWSLAMPRDKTFPPSIVGAVRQRLGRLHAKTVEILRTASIVGRTFDVVFLADVAGEETEVVEEHLRAAMRARLIQAEKDNCYAFSHDTVRECLYDEVTTSRRRRLHGFIGRTLEGQSGEDSARRLADLAFHFTRSGDRVRGAQYSGRAAERALEDFAPAEAMALYRAALDLGDADDQRRGDLLMGLGQAAILAGAEREAVAAFDTAREWFLTSGDRVAAARAAHGQGQSWWRQEAHDAARAAFETALQLLEDSPGVELVQVLVDLGSLLAVSLGRHPEGILHGRRALALARNLNDTRLEATANRAVGNLLVRGNDIPSGVPILERALELAITADDPAEAAECCSCLALAYGWQGELRRAFEMARRREEFARRCHDLYQLRHALTWLAGWFAVNGKWGEMEQALDRAESIVERLASPEPLAFLHHMRGALAFWRGDYAEAEEQFLRATDIFRQLGPSVLVWYLGPLGVIRILRGKRQEALACLAELEGLVASQPAGTMPTADALTYLSMMALLFGDRERAVRYHAQLLPFEGLRIDVQTDRILGELETLLGDLRAAQRHLAAAEASARREDDRMEQARTLEAWANLVLAEGGRGCAARARELFGQALILFRELAMKGDERRLRDRLRNLPSVLGSRLRSTLPARLSEREAAVLRLVVEGKSNRQIADELVLSEKTIANHLTSIFNKIGVDNRASAAAFAIRHGLAD
jgi:DNA-binding NarL/FixJ family response regulator